MYNHFQLKRINEKEQIPKELRHTLYSIGTVKKVGSNTYIFREGMDAGEIFIIKSGLIKVSKLTPEGKKLTLRICTSGDIIGELTLFNNNPTYLLSAKVIWPGEILVISKNRLEEELKTNGELALEFMKWGSVHMRKFQTKIRDLL